MWRSGRDQLTRWIRDRRTPEESAAGPRAVYRELERLAATNRRILAGPWLSELGFEILYWIPFLNWATRAYDIPPERLLIVSRGGAADLYRHLASEYVDVFDHWTVGEFRTRNEERWTEDGHQPQYCVGRMDREVVSLVSNSHPGEQFEVLHPALMHQLFRPCWYERGPFSLVRKHTNYLPLARDAQPLDGLPPEYLAVRFYFRPSFPDTPANRTCVSNLVSGLSRQLPVVVLGPGEQLDDHADVPVAEGQRVHVLRPHSGRTNLEIQIRVIRQARALIGTYGGVSYLASACGVPSFGLYSDDVKLLPAHVDAGARFGRIMAAPALMVHVDQLSLFGHLATSVARLDAPPIG